MRQISPHSGTSTDDLVPAGVMVDLLLDARQSSRAAAAIPEIDAMLIALGTRRLLTQREVRDLLTRLDAAESVAGPPVGEAGEQDSTSGSRRRRWRRPEHG